MGFTMAVVCIISYWLIAQILAHVFSVSGKGNLLGGVWAMIAARI